MTPTERYQHLHDRTTKLQAIVTILGEIATIAHQALQRGDCLMQLQFDVFMTDVEDELRLLLPFHQSLENLDFVLGKVKQMQGELEAIIKSQLSRAEREPRDD